MDKKFVVIVLIERSIFRAVTFNRPHPWGRIPGIRNEVRVFRMKLRMDNRLIWRGIDNLAPAAIGSSNRNVRFIVTFHCRHDKPFICADAALTETPAREFRKRAFLKRLKMDCFYSIPLRIKEFGCRLWRSHRSSRGYRQHP